MLFLQTGSESKVQWGKSANNPDQRGQSTFSNRPLRGLISHIHLNSDLQHVANLIFKQTQLLMHTNKNLKQICKELQLCTYTFFEIMEKHTHTHTPIKALTLLLVKIYSQVHYMNTMFSVVKRNNKTQLITNIIK